MARSLARSSPPIGVAAATLAVLYGLATPAPRPLPPPPPAAAALAAHAPAKAAWGEAPARVYDAVARTGLAHAEATGVARAILEESLAAAIDPQLVLAVIHVESRFDPRAVSPAGAVGLMQLMPFTLREVALRHRLGAPDPFDPVRNVRAGIRYLTELVGAFGDLELALMAYNAGPARIRAHLRGGGVPSRLLRYPREVLRHARGAPALAATSLPLAAAHARPRPADAVLAAPAALGPRLPGSLAARELPREVGAALRPRRVPLVPVALVGAS